MIPCLRHRCRRVDRMWRLSDGRNGADSTGTKVPETIPAIRSLRIGDAVNLRWLDEESS